VAADFGIYNVGFEGGFAMYKKALFQELVDGLDIVGKSNSFVLYFEVENLAELEEEIVRNGFEFIHKTREQPWKQRVFRFYDYDNHIVEIAEKMDAVSHRLYQEGKTIEEISELTGMPVNQVLQQINKYKGMD
jgi:hypothetical protein